MDNLPNMGQLHTIVNGTKKLCRTLFALQHEYATVVSTRRSDRRSCFCGGSGGDPLSGSPLHSRTWNGAGNLI